MKLETFTSSIMYNLVAAAGKPETGNRMRQQLNTLRFRLQRM